MQTKKVVFFVLLATVLLSAFQTMTASVYALNSFNNPDEPSRSSHSVNGSNSCAQSPNVVFYPLQSMESYNQYVAGLLGPATSNSTQCMP